MNLQRAMRITAQMHPYRSAQKCVARFNTAQAVLFVMLLLTALAVGAEAQSQSTSGAATFALAESALARNDPQAAIQVLSSHLSRNPTDLPARLLLAEAFLAAGNPGEAESQYRTILRGDTNNYLALAGLGELYEKTGRLDQAESNLARAVKHSRGEPELRLEWATVLAKLHRFREAKSALLTLTIPKTRASRVAYFRLKAAIAEGMGDSTAAAAEMESALAADPANTDLRTAAAMAQARAGSYKRAAALAAESFSHAHDVTSGMVLLQAQVGGGEDVHETLRSLRDLSLPRQQSGELRQHLAELLIARGKYEDAVVDLEALAGMSPDSAEVLFNLALAHFRAGQMDAAAKSAEQCRRLKDTAEVEDLIGDIQEARGDVLAAVRSYQAAASLAPEEEKYQVSLALEFIRHQNFEPAKVVLENAAKSHPNSWQIRLCLGMIEYFTGTKSKASEILLRAADLSPTPEVVLGYLGDVEMDEVSPPDKAAVDRICAFADAHPSAAREQLNCGALQLKQDYATRDKSRISEIKARLVNAARSLSNQAESHCELGKLYRWTEEWTSARAESERCAEMEPDSAEAHYRLAQIYQHTGEAERSKQEMAKFQQTSEKLANANEQRQKTMKTFLYKIQNEKAGQR